MLTLNIKNNVVKESKDFKFLVLNEMENSV